MEFMTFIVYASIYLGLIATSFYVLSYRANKKRNNLMFNDSELPTVSVIIPVWNEEKTIERTLVAILASDYPHRQKLLNQVFLNNPLYFPHSAYL